MISGVYFLVHFFLSKVFPFGTYLLADFNEAKRIFV